MARTPKAPINPAVLLWAREIAGFDVATVAKRVGVKPETVMAWEASDDQPSMAKLRAIAEMFRRTPASFFLPEPPVSDLPRPPDFRGEDADELSPELRREMRKVILRRDALLELHGPPERSFEGSALDLRGDLELAAASIRDELGITIEEQWAASNAGHALKRWIRAVEDRGALVFQMSRIKPRECRGFSIYEAQYPIIVLNGGDSVEARIFTLIHELAHVLSSSGSVCTLWVKEAIEQRCNAFAAETLMPRQAFLLALGTQDPISAVPALASRFRVSQEATAVRLRTLNRITQAQLDQIRSDIAQYVQERSEQTREQEGGPPHYRTHLRNLGETYVSTVLDAYYGNQISLVDAAHYLESKISTIQRMEREIQVRGSVV